MKAIQQCFPLVPFVVPYYMKFSRHLNIAVISRFSHERETKMSLKTFNSSDAGLLP